MSCETQDEGPNLQMTWSNLCVRPSRGNGVRLLRGGRVDGA